MNTNIQYSEEEGVPYFIDRIMPPNFEGIRQGLPHRLYADNNGGWMEVQTEYIPHYFGEKRDTSGIIVGIRISWIGGGKLETFFIDRGGMIYVIDLYGGLDRVRFDVNLLYMLLNPIEKMGNWCIQDITEAQKHHTFDTNIAVGIQSNWGYTTTFHPDLEPMMKRVKHAVRNRL